MNSSLSYLLRTLLYQITKPKDTIPQGNVKAGFTLLNWIHNSRLSKNPPSPPFEKGGNRKSPFVKGDLEGFSSAQHDMDETLHDSSLRSE
jgi:hypothetical protein